MFVAGSGISLMVTNPVLISKSVADKLSVTCKEMVFEPAVEYVTTCGPAPVADGGNAPAPKFQLQLVIVAPAAMEASV